MAKPLKKNETFFVNSLQFVVAAGGAGWSKWSAIFFLSNGISASQLAIITSVQSITKFLGYPTFGLFADYFGNSRTLLLVSLTVSNIILLLFYFESTSSIIFANFGILLFIRGLRSYSNSIWSLVDAITMKLIIDKKSYGKHRLFCSIAWGLSSLLSGKLIDIYGINTIFIYGLFWSVISFNLIYFLMPTNVENNYVKHKYQSLSIIDNDDSDNETIDDNINRPQYKFSQIFTLLISLRYDYQFIFCLILMIIYWNSMFIVERIIFIQMDQEFGSTKTMMGIATLSTTISEIPFFYYSTNWMKKYSLNFIFIFCHIVLMIRLCLYILCKDISMIWIIYCISTLHGITFGLAFSVCRVYLYQIGEYYSINNDMGIDVRATMQSLKGLIVVAEMFFGSLIWYPLYDNYNAQTVYLYGSLSLIPSMLILCSMNLPDKLFNAHNSNAS